MRLFHIILLCFVLCGCATTDLPSVTSSHGLYFEEDEKGFWSRSEEEQKKLEKSGLIYHDEELDAYLNDIAQQLYPADIFTHIPFRVMVIMNHHLNAFAYPNGTIYIHTGLLARMDNEAQLATLLAHEMTHCTHRHLVKNFRSVKNKTAFLATVTVAIGGIGGGLATMIGTLGTMAAVSGYSRDLETEADMEGIQQVIRAGYDADESPKLFVYLKKELEDEKKKEPFFFGSHPRLQERIDNYQSFLRNNKQNGGIKNTETFLKKIDEIILLNSQLDLKAGRFTDAQRGAEKYLNVNPNDAKGYYTLGEIARQRSEKDDIEKAAAHYKKALALQPAYPEPFKGLGLLYMKKNEKQYAKSSLESYLSLCPTASDKAYIEAYIIECKEGGEQ